MGGLQGAVGTLAPNSVYVYGLLAIAHAVCSLLQCPGSIAHACPVSTGVFLDPQVLARTVTPRAVSHTRASRFMSTISYVLSLPPYAPSPVPVHRCLHGQADPMRTPGSPTTPRHASRAPPGSQRAPVTPADIKALIRNENIWIRLFKCIVSIIMWCS